MHTLLDHIIFTKGVEYLIAIGFMAAFIIFWLVLAKPAAAKAPAAAGTFALPLNYFLAKNHSWAMPRESGLVEVGLDDFARQLMGRIDHVETAEVGSIINAGDPIATLHQGDRIAMIRTPVSGTVRRQNKNIAAETGNNINSNEPYKSWIVAVEPKTLGENLRAMTIGKDAVGWLRTEVERLIDFFKKRDVIAADAAYDASVLAEGILEKLGEDVWKSFGEEFLQYK